MPTLHALRVPIVAIAASVAGCSHGSPAQPPAEAAASAAPAASMPAPVIDAPVAMPADLIASTNEPFWQVRVSATEVMLEGPDGMRRFALQSNQVLFDGRNVMAKDATGALELRVAGMACQDSMSGAWFPYTARLTLDDRPPVLGCARGASDPLPRPQ